MDIMVDYYKILDIPQSASLADIKKAYRSKVLRWHPDKNPDNRKEAERRFKEIVEAYKVLSDKSTQDHYNGNINNPFKGSKRSESEKHLTIFDQDGIKIFFTGQSSSSDFSVSFFSAPKRFHHFSIMTAFINGKKITTKRHLENESKYLEVEEDGKTVSVHVNGIPLYDRETMDKEHCGSDKCRFWSHEKRRWADEWRSWAKKWRSWAEECRAWAKEKGPSEGRATSVGHGWAEAEHPQANEEYPKSEAGFKPGGMFPGFPVSGEEKTIKIEGPFKPNKGLPRPEDELPKAEKGYFIFPKPGEKTIPDEGHLRTSKRQVKPESKGNSGNVRPAERHQDELQIRTKKVQLRPEEVQSRLDKVHNGLQKPDQNQPDPAKKNPDAASHESRKKQKNVFDRLSPSKCRKAHVVEPEQQAEEIKQQATKNEVPPVKKELKNEKVRPNSQTRGSSSEPESEKGQEGLGMRRKSSASIQITPKPQLIANGFKDSLVKIQERRKETQMRIRKLCGKRSKSRSGRSKSRNSKNKSPAGKDKIHVQEKMAAPGEKDLGDVLAPGGKKTPVDRKASPHVKKKGLLPPFQEDRIPLLTKKRLPRRKAHHFPTETKGEKRQSLSDTCFLATNSHRRGRSMKVLQNNADLPGIQGQKFGMNQLPKVIR